MTTLSPKGQVVIPQGIRDGMNIQTGTKFAVYSRGDTLIFKKITIPTVQDFEKIAAFGREFTKKKNIKAKDILKDD